jgi:hypothetical protein
VGTAKSPPEEGSGGLSLSVVWVGLFLPDVYFVVNALHVVDEPSLVCYATLANFFTINHCYLHVSIMPCKGRNNNISYPQICPQVYPQVHEESPGRPQPRVVQRFLNLLRWRKGNRNENLDASRRGWRTHRKKGKEKPPTMKGKNFVEGFSCSLPNRRRTKNSVFGLPLLVKLLTTFSMPSKK